MKVTITPIVIGEFGTVTKGILKGLGELEVGEQVETIRITSMLKTARILRKVLETWGDLLLLRLHSADVENSKGVNNNNNNNNDLIT